MAVTATSHGDILARIFRPEEADLSVEAARSILKLTFSAEDREYMDVLAEKARQGTLSEEEKADIQAYELINNLLGIMKTKARRCLKEFSSEQN